MSDETQAIPKLQPIYFTPGTLARIAPDISLQKHLNIGLRPSLRKFEEFKPVTISTAGLSRYENKDGSPSRFNNVIGSGVVKSGSTTVICGITAGIIEDSDAFINDYRVKLDNDIITINDDTNSGKTKNASVYSVVEVSKGRTGPPSDEEMYISQKLYENLYHSGLISQESLKVKLGLKSYDENGKAHLIYGDGNDSDEEFKPKKNFSFVLYANIQVFSRSGPVFDLCWGSLISALKNTFLPSVFIDEKKTDIKSSIRSRSGQHSVTESDYDLICDPKIKNPLLLDETKISWSSSYGVIDINEEFKVKTVTSEDEDADGDVSMDEEGIIDSVGSRESVLLADLEGESEEEIWKRINVISNSKGNLAAINIVSGGSQRITKDMIVKAIDLSELRSKSILQDTYGSSR